jgi:hypothetical protein
MRLPNSDFVEAAAGSRGGTSRHRLCLYGLASVSLLVAVLPAAAAVPHGSVVAWGCESGRRAGHPSPEPVAA